jgi:glycosyltransferase involved in cell wall biosynthesis
MTKDKTISVLLPAYNEEKNVVATVEEALKALGDHFAGYEIIVIDDCSSDHTGELADSMAQQNPNVKVLHNETNKGFGYSYKRGVAAATCDYVSFFPADNCIPWQCIEAVFEQVGKADIILNFTSNLEIRVPMRRLLSRIYTGLMNFLFGLRFTIINGPTVHRREVIQGVEISTDGFAFMAEIMVRLVRSGHSYLEIGTPIRERKYGSVKAFKLRNVISVFKTALLLFWDVNVARRKEYRHWGRRVLTTIGPAPEVRSQLELGN